MNSIKKKVPEIDSPEELIQFAININSISCGEPSDYAKKIMKLFAEDIIDFDTAEKEILKAHHL